MSDDHDSYSHRGVGGGALHDQLHAPSFGHSDKIARASVGQPATSALRSLVDITRAQSEGRQRSNDHFEYALPEGVPRGPYPTAQLLKDALNAWAHPLGFHLKLGRLVQASDHGPWYYIQCSKEGQGSGKKIGKERQSKSSRCGCDYCIVCEEIDSGWVPFKYKDVHNHLCTIGPERLAHAGIRTHALHDDDLCSFGRLLYDSGVGLKTTCKVMKKYALSRGLDSHFTVKDVRNKIGETAKEKALDATNAVKELLRVKDENGVHVQFETDEDARLDTVFFEMPGAAAKFDRGASIGGSQRVHVILYDTTFNTTRKGLKLGFITSVDEHRRTYILATTMVMNEDHESFAWCFAEFKKAFGVESTAIFTDSDPALAKAIAQELPHSKHFLCPLYVSLITQPYHELQGSVSAS